MWLVCPEPTSSFDGGTMTGAKRPGRSPRKGESARRESEGDPFAFLLISGLACVIALVIGIGVGLIHGNVGAGLVGSLFGAIAGVASYVVGWDRGPGRGEGCLLYILPIALPFVVTAFVGWSMSTGQSDLAASVGGLVVIFAMIAKVTGSIGNRDA